MVTNMVIDMNIADVVILIVVSLCIYHYMLNRKGTKKECNQEEKSKQKESSKKEDSIQEKVPVIRVIFQVDTDEEDEDLAREIADMFLEGRTYYYTGKAPEGTANKKTEESENEKFVRFEDVQWNLLKTIEV